MEDNLERKKSKEDGDIPSLKRKPGFFVLGVHIGWPFPEIMSPQLKIAIHIISALNNRSHCIIESPTGTGKSAAILCSILAWQRHTTATEGSAVVPKIFYCSKTHSQIAQAVASLRKTPYRPHMAILGSRERLCLQDDATVSSSKSSVNNSFKDRMRNTDRFRKERLKQQRKGEPSSNGYEYYNDDDPPKSLASDSLSSTGRTCPYYRNLTSPKVAETAAELFRPSRALTNSCKDGDEGTKLGTHDVEDLVEFGRQHRACPYTLSQILEKDAEIVFAPYNYILDPNIRGAKSISLNNTIVVLDEAHNVESVLKDSAKVEINEIELRSLLAFLEERSVPKNSRGLSTFTQMDYTDDKDDERGSSKKHSFEVALELYLFVKNLMQICCKCAADFGSGLASDTKRMAAVQEELSHGTRLFERQYYGPRGVYKSMGNSVFSPGDRCDKFFHELCPTDSSVNDYMAEVKMCMKIFLEEMEGGDDDSKAKCDLVKDLLRKLYKAYKHSEHYYAVLNVVPNGDLPLDPNRAGFSPSTNSKSVERPRLKLDPCEILRVQAPDSARRIMGLKKASFREVGGSTSDEQLLRADENKAPAWIGMLTIELLSPSLVMKKLRKQCHSVILASGTLAPISSLAAELDLKPRRAISTAAVPLSSSATELDAKPKASVTMIASEGPVLSGKHDVDKCDGDDDGDRLQVKPPPLEAGHVIDLEKQLRALSIGHAPDGTELTINLKNRRKPGFLSSLGDAIAKVVEAIPSGGVLVFFPSYPFLKECVNAWEEDGIYKRIEKSKKRVIEESSNSSQATFEETKISYSRNVKRFGSCVLLAVYRGKMSEGVSFNDNNARCVICVGIPFANPTERGVVSKKNYNDEQVHRGKNLLPGRPWYDQSAYQAVAQALGRCIRHSEDYGTVVLMDARYNSASKRSKLPKWMRGSVREMESWNALKTECMTFFENATNLFGKTDVVGVPRATGMMTLAAVEDGDVREAELIVKKSKFIALARSCDTFSSASSFVASIRNLHPEADHVTFAFRSGLTIHKSDDGEPNGTAGSPIFTAMASSNLTDVVCVVVRYFGGILLGIDGLIRAYGKAALLALDRSEWVEMDRASIFKVRQRDDDDVKKSLVESSGSRDVSSSTAKVTNPYDTFTQNADAKRRSSNIFASTTVARKNKKVKTLAQMFSAQEQRLIERREEKLSQQEDENKEEEQCIGDKEEEEENMQQQKQGKVERKEEDGDHESEQHLDEEKQEEEEKEGEKEEKEGEEEMKEEMEEEEKEEEEKEEDVQQQSQLQQPPLQSRPSHEKEVIDLCEEDTFSGDDLLLCVVCMERERNILLLPCAHLCVCQMCSKNMLSDCPICRSDIVNR